MNLKLLIGSGDKIGRFTVPFIIVGVILNLLFPAFFSVGGPSEPLRTVSILILIPGLINWLWSVYLIVTKVPKHELITTGPYALVKHPLYTGVSLLVLPWLGFLLNTWLGLVLGIILYLASRRFAPEEEQILAKHFGSAWKEYTQQVKIPWL